MPKCSKCTHVAPSLGQLRKHHADAHPGAFKKRRKKNGKDHPPQDWERSFLSAASEVFDAELAVEELTQDAYDRVIAYLQSRYGSAVATEAA
jgi:hypothetical protein